MQGKVAQRETPENRHQNSHRPILVSVHFPKKTEAILKAASRLDRV